MLTLGAVSNRRYDLLQRLIESAERGSLKPDAYLVVDTGGGLNGKIASGEIVLPSFTEVIWLGGHPGVAGAWNWMMRKASDWLVLANDDIEMGETTLENMVRGAEGGAEFVTVAPGAMFSLFLLSHACYERVGLFDENFWPAYFEDNDYHRRLKLAHAVELGVDDGGFRHVGGATHSVLTDLERWDHERQFSANERYYKQKWGGPPGHETHTSPQYASK